MNLPFDEQREEHTLLERLREKRAKAVRGHNAAMKEFNRMERLLVETEAENVVNEAIELIAK